MTRIDGRMVRTIRFFGLFLAASLVNIAPCAGQQTDQSLVVAWAQLDDAELDGNFLHATVLLPQELMRSLAFVAERYPSKEEFEAAQEKSRMSSQETARLAVAAARKRRDFVALTVQDEARRAAELLSAESAIRVAEAKLAELVSTPEAKAVRGTGPLPDSVDEARSVTLVRWQKHLTGSLVDKVRDPAATCEKEKIDVLIYGSAGLTGNFISIDIAVYLASLGTVVWQGREYSSPDGLDSAAAAFTRPVAEAVLGRSYALATYAIKPPTAIVTIDGKTTNAASQLFLVDGEHEIRATAAGYEPESLSFRAQTGTDIVLDLNLEAQPSENFAISSEPPGASIHIDGEFAGVTPVEIEGTGFPRVARSSMPGYQDVQLIVKPDASPGDFQIHMTPSDGSSFNDRFDSSKDRFYTSLGFFVLSLPTTVISGGLFQTYYNASTAANDLYGESIDPVVVTRLNTGFYSTQAIFWVSAAASVGLAVNAIIRFIMYLNTSS